MGLSDTGEVLQHVLNGKVHGNARARIAAVYQPFKVLILPDELILHGVPHHLVDSRNYHHYLFTYLMRCPDMLDSRHSQNAKETFLMILQ